MHKFFLFLREGEGGKRVVEGNGGGGGERGVCNRISGENGLPTELDSRDLGGGCLTGLVEKIVCLQNWILGF